MLRVNQNSRVDVAKSYFSTADYYSEGQELTGRWRGVAARMLGLEGDVQQADWESLCDNRHPHTGEQLTPRNESDRTVGYDFNFHVPKSFSILYAMTRDKRLLDAFRDAVDATMRDIEAEMAARVRKAGKNENRTTGNMVWGEYVHFTSRPVDGVPDPHLHAHCFAFNATWDSPEQSWKAGQFRNLLRDAPYFEAVFHSRLTERLAGMGLPIERTAKGWELGGLPKTAIDKFSRRTKLIEDKAREKGITDVEAKAALGAKTRQLKTKDLSFPELQDTWRSRMSPQELDAVAALEHKVGDDAPPPDETSSARALGFAIDHSFERKSVVPERHVLASALRHSYGNLVLDNGWVVDREFGHLTHGYVVTSHASQGKTVDRVFVGQASESFPASSREQFYVSVSRARKGAIIYTDDKDALREAISQSDERVTATEFVNGAAARQAVALRQQREPLPAPVKQPQREMNYER